MHIMYRTAVGTMLAFLGIVDFGSLWTLKLYTVHIPLTSISGSARFVADKSCSWFNYHHIGSSSKRGEINSMEESGVSFWMMTDCESQIYNSWYSQRRGYIVCSSTIGNIIIKLPFSIKTWNGESLMNDIIIMLVGRVLWSKGIKCTIYESTIATLATYITEASC